MASTNFITNAIEPSTSVIYCGNRTYGWSNQLWDQNKQSSIFSNKIGVAEQGLFGIKIPYFEEIDSVTPEWVLCTTISIGKSQAYDVSGKIYAVTGDCYEKGGPQAANDNESSAWKITAGDNTVCHKMSWDLNSKDDPCDMAYYGFNYASSGKEPLRLTFYVSWRWDLIGTVTY